MKRLYFFVLILFLCAQVQARQKYWIYLNEKNPVIKNADRQSRIDHLRSHGFIPVVYSEWLGAVSVHLPDSLSAESFLAPCLSYWEPVRGQILPAGSQELQDLKYDEVLRQIHGDKLVEAGYTGKNIKIGVIDAGFLNADKNRFLKPLIENRQILGFRNFVEAGDSNIYSHDYHGTQVLMHIAGYREQRDQVKGMAWDAQFFLARTDQDDREYRGEEDYWIAALEWMHSQGVRIVNSSLGYSDGYDDPGQDYTPENADGKSTAIARAATMAVEEKGMILVISAGNEGNKSFRVVSIPADAEGVISVGATTLSWPWTRQGYSSIGPPDLPYVKPDVACYSFSGTSYSAPVIAGMAAGLWQARPDLSNKEVAQWILESGHLSSSPNNYLGYGVPDARVLVKRINNEPVNTRPSQRVRVTKNYLVLPGTPESVVVYHKENNLFVRNEYVIRDTREGFTIHRPKDISQTTIVYPNRLVEIVWED